MKEIQLFILLVISQFGLSQQVNPIKTLKEVVITSERIDLPFSKNSRTIQIISSIEIKNSAVTNLADLLQNIPGIDIRRRGIDGMQSDIYIRGGHFNQTLILIDGIKVEDPQTGHHTMNVMPPIENIERIEIIKGPAARVYGQNAFLGAINIVTKTNTSQHITVHAKGGSFGRLFWGIDASLKTKTTNHQFSFSDNSSKGYRPNTDFKNRSYFIKSTIRTKNNPVSILAMYTERKFGANNFYTFNPAFDEYEETKTGLFSVSSRFNKGSWILKPSIYWKLNQDIFLLKRNNPEFSQNNNLSNKIGGQLNTSHHSKNGITGLGVDASYITLLSNNLGNQNRISTTAFVEHRLSVFQDRLDFTPGISIHYFSDFGFHVFPGLDLGYKINKSTKVYGNIGYSYRVPTYTEMYISIPGFLSGNSRLNPEKAFAQEIGANYFNKYFSFSTALFRREAKDLIDYIKQTENSRIYKAQNIRKITTLGWEAILKYSLLVLNNKQALSLGYTYLKDDFHEIDIFASRYLINSSMKHQLVISGNFTFYKIFQTGIYYRYVERPTNKYNILDIKLSTDLAGFTFSVIANNIFNTNYMEKANIPMPKRNILIGAKYRFE